MSDETSMTIDVLRHSAAHLLAHAVLDLYPETKTGIGPAVETGFYYDFLREKAFVPEDLDAIEKRMKEIARENIPVEKLVLTKDEAVRMFEEKKQELKVELIREKGDVTVTVYRQGPFADFCLGPHVPATGVLQHVKLLSVSGAYWKGDERGPQMQRIYGTVSFSKKELEDHLRLLEEAKKRDHRRLGAELDLFSTDDEVGIPRARASGPSSSSTGGSAIGPAATTSCSPPTSGGRPFGRPRATSASIKTACIRRWTSMTRPTT
jgi:threonyl-tRNA synthetase